MTRDFEAQLRLAEAAHTEAQLRHLVEVLLQQGQTLLSSRRWRIGSAIVRGMQALLRLTGRRFAPAQDLAHWREIVAAHDAALHRRRVLLDALCADPAREADLDGVLAALWQQVAREPDVSGTGAGGIDAAQ